VSRDAAYLLNQQELERQARQNHAGVLHEASYTPNAPVIKHSHRPEPPYLEFGNPYGGREHPYRHPYHHQSEYTSPYHHHQGSQFHPHGHYHEHARYAGIDQQRHGRSSESNSPLHFPNPFAGLFGQAGQSAQGSNEFARAGEYIASLARHFAVTNPSTHDANGLGECSKVPRKVLNALGIPIGGMSGVRQGQTLENCGLFERIPASEARAGDFGYRHWAHRHGDLGDSFVVTGREGGTVVAVNGAQRNEFAVSDNGGYYKDAIYLRPTAEFFRRYGHRIAGLNQERT
jgi:hypothetical protein